MYVKVCEGCSWPKYSTLHGRSMGTQIPTHKERPCCVVYVKRLKKIFASIPVVSVEHENVHGQVVFGYKHIETQCNASVCTLTLGIHTCYHVNKCVKAVKIRVQLS